MISCSTLIETMVTFSSYNQLFVESCRLYPTQCIWWPCWGWPHSNFAKIFGIRKL